MEREPVFHFEKNLSNPETSANDDMSKKKEKKKGRAELLTKRSAEEERRSRDSEADAKRAGEKLLNVVRKDGVAKPAGETVTKASDLEVPSGLDADHRFEESTAEPASSVERSEMADTATSPTHPENASAEDSDTASPESQESAELLQAEKLGQELVDGSEPEPDAPTQPVETSPVAPEFSPAEHAANNQAEQPAVEHAAESSAERPVVHPTAAGGGEGGGRPPRGPELPNDPLDPNNPNWNIDPPLTNVVAPGNGPVMGPRPSAERPVETVTSDDVVAAEKRGLRKGLVSGGLASWWLTRRSQTKKREALSRELHQEIRKRDQRIDQLSATPSEVVQPAKTEAAAVPERPAGVAERMMLNREAAPARPRAEIIASAATKLAEAQSRPSAEVAAAVPAEAPAVKPEAVAAKPEKTIAESEPVGASVSSIETAPTRSPLAETRVEQAPTPQEAEKRFREDAFEKLDRPQDQGGVSGGGAAAGPASPTIHNVQIGPAIAHDPAARSISQARQRAEAESARVTQKLRRELYFIGGGIVVVVLWLVFMATR